MSRSKNWRSIYINKDLPFGQFTQAIQQNGWKVYNAPRPIPGAITWQDECRHGVFYAAGSEQLFGKQWEDLDAWPVEAIDNAWVFQQITFKIWDYGYLSVRAFMLSNFHRSLAELANSMGLPWRDELLQLPDAAAVECYQVSNEQRWMIENIIPASIPGQLGFVESKQGIHTLIYTFDNLENAMICQATFKELGINTKGDW